MAVSGDGATAVVGAYGDFSSAGAAYVFTKSGATWSTGALLGSGSAANVRLGASVAMSGDGTAAVAGAYGDFSYAGAAYLFTQSGATWSTGALLGSGSSAGGQFGTAVSMADDGATAMVGAIAAYSQAGAAYVFTKSGATWSTGALLGLGRAGNDHFGTAVAMSGTGAYAVVGANNANSYAGAAYLFTNSGATWSCSLA